jgi:dihydroorotase
LDNLHVSQGWFDSSVSLGEPGRRETIVNGLSVAAKVVLRLSLCNNSFYYIESAIKLTLFRIKQLAVHNFSQLV